MIARLLEDALRWDGPARWIPAYWRDNPQLDAAVARHPAGKGLRPGP